MCGDIETEETRGEAFYQRFAEHAGAFLTTLGAERDAGSSEPLHAYLDALFHDALAAAADRAGVPEEVSGYQRLSMEPLVYARLAGFMAAHQPLEDDPLRRLIEAVMTGYAEGEAVISKRRPEPSHGHGHDHAHTH